MKESEILKGLSIEELRERNEFSTLGDDPSCIICECGDGEL